MHTSNSHQRFIRLSTLGVLIAAGLCSSPAFASNKTTTPSRPAPPPKAATPPARPAGTAGRPASGTGAAGARPGTSGVSTGGANHPAITTGGAHSGAVTTGGAGSAGGARPPITTNTRPVSTNRPTTNIPSTRQPAPTLGKTPVHPPSPAPLKTSKTAFGSVSRDSHGNLRNVHDDRRGMDVHHTLNGSRSVSVERADHSRVFAERGRAGYISRPYGFHGHGYDSRTYGWHGHVYQRTYREYGFRGANVYVYGPRVFYAPGFYGWAYYPWASPVAFGWGWGAEPWYGSYGFYFAPYPTYAGPSYWLTDYVISQNLAAAYSAQQAQQTQVAYSQPTGQPLLTPEVKAQISDEVKQQIQVELAESQANAQGQEPDPNVTSINRVFSDGQRHVFIANASLDVTDMGGSECPLSDGDVLQLAPPQDPNAKAGALTVLASKGGKECRQGATVNVGYSDLQEMQNGMRANLDQGMQQLSEGKGTPKPPMGSSATTPSAVAGAAPQPDADVEAELKRQLTAADEVDKAAATAPAQPNATSMLRSPAGWQPGRTVADMDAEPAELLAAESRIPLPGSMRW